MYSNFTSLSTTYDYSLPQVQLTMPLLTNRRYGSALATKHPYLTVWVRLPHQWLPHIRYRLLAATRTKALAYLPLLETSFRCFQS